MNWLLYVLIGVASFIFGYSLRGLIYFKQEAEYEKEDKEILNHIFKELDKQLLKALDVEPEVVLMITKDLSDLYIDVNGERLNEYKGHEVHLVDEEGLGGYALPKSIFDKFIEEKYGKE